MIEANLHRLRDWPLSLKLIAALALALVPLGVIAALLSANSYRAIVAERSLLAISRFEAFERVIVANLNADFTVLRTALLDTPIDTESNRAVGCALLGRVVSVDRVIRSATRVDAEGRSVCGDAPLPPAVRQRLRRLGTPREDARFQRAVIAEPGREAFWLVVRDDIGRVPGDAVAARISTPALERLLGAPSVGQGERLVLSDGALTVARWGDGHCPPDACIEIERPIGPAGLWLEFAQVQPGLTFGQASSIGLPLLMWGVALAIGWFGAQRFVVQPLVRMQRAVERYRRGDSGVRVGTSGFGSLEMAEFAAAFDHMADDLQARSRAIEAALGEQRRLTREVHHRVKNNLQIITSLLSIEGRDASSPEVARGYAAMQARVGALALVHRLVYDDSGARAIDLRGMLAELAAALEQQPGSDADAIRIEVDSDTVEIDQDVAVPLAFLITELAGVATDHASSDGLDLAIVARADADHIALTIATPEFDDDILAAASSNSTRRIVQGMARQLRGAFAHDPDGNGYRLEFTLPTVKG